MRRKRCAAVKTIGEYAMRCLYMANHDGDHAVKTPAEYDRSPLGDEIIMFRTRTRKNESSLRQRGKIESGEAKP